MDKWNHPRRLGKWGLLKPGTVCCGLQEIPLGQGWVGHKSEQLLGEGGREGVMGMHSKWANLEPQVLEGKL